MAISGIISSSSREVPYAPASVSGVDYGTARAYNNARADITFTAPVHNGGLPVTGYTVTSSPGGLTATGASSPLSVTGLSSSTNYTYNVTATNAIGTGPAITSGQIFATTIPQPATIGTATATGGAGTVSISFTPNGTGGKTVTYTATSSPGGITASSSGSPINVTGLTNGTAYTFTVVAANANGSAAASAASNSATPYTYVAPVLYPPGFVSTPVASASGNSVTSTSGSWANGSATSFIYKLYQGASPSGTFITNSNQITNTSFTFTGLSYSTNYWVLVEAYNGDGGNSAASNTATTGAAPTAPSVPRNLYLSANTASTGGTYGFTCPDSGTLPITVQWGLSAPYAAVLVTSGAYTCYSYSDFANFSQGSNGYYGHFAYATNAGGTSGTVSATDTFAYAPCTTPGAVTSLAGQAFTINGYQGEFTWSAPSGGADRYSYSINGAGGATTTNTNVYLTSLTASTTYTISIYAQRYCADTGFFQEGPGATASFTTGGAAAPYRYNCTTSSPCAGIGNCTYTNPSTNTSGSGTGYSTACLYNNTSTYPSCSSTAGAGCTTNLSCCSVSTMYICNNYDYSDPASANYAGHCYSVGACDAPYNSSGSRSACCPSAC
jgi:hypothetical protein